MTRSNVHVQRLGALLAAGGLLLASGTTARGAEEPHTFSANIGVVSNYVWRGLTQTDDGPAIQGGLDYEHASGFYAGTWASNVDFGEGENLPAYELDAYLGFGGKINDDLGYDLKLGYYAYPDGRDSDFSEVQASMTWTWLTAGVAYTIYGQADEAPGAIEDEALYIQGDLHYFVNLEVQLPYELGLSLRSGYSDFRYNDGGNDYANWGLTISREAGDFGTFSLNYDQVGRDTYDDDPKVWISWLKKF
jgi:uncharacterized protein (TIGR02001 family)